MLILRMDLKKRSFILCCLHFWLTLKEFFMEITVDMLLGSIDYDSTYVEMPLGYNEPIRAVSPYSNDLSAFEPDVLYIAKASDLVKSTSYRLPAQILCIKDSDIPAELLENNKSNIIAVNENLEPIALFQHVQATLLKYQRLASGSSKLLNSLIENKGLQHIVDIGFEMFGNPVCLTDLSHKILAITRNVEVSDPFWKTLLETGYMEHELITKTAAMGIFEKARNCRRPILYKPEFTNFYAIFCDIFIDSKAVAHMTIPGSEKQLTEKDLEKASLLSKVISLEMQKSKFFRNIKGTMFEYFIVDLLNENIHDRDKIRDRLQYLDWSPKENIFVLTIQSGNFYDENVSLVEIRDKLSELIFDSKSVIYNDDIVMVISRSEDVPFSDAELSGLIFLLEENHLRAGISRSFSCLEDITEHYRQSVKAIELGLASDKRKRLFYYEDYAVDHLLETCAYYQKIEKFCHPSLFALEKYDEENGSNLMECLYTYLKCDKNLIEASSVLHIHRNTLSYRINKIVEILKLDIFDKDISFHLLLSFKILKFTRRR